jgi:hypothetical protein
MSRKNGNGRWLAGTLLAIALTACGTIQGATPAGAGIPSTGASSDNHLTEFDASDSHGSAIRTDNGLDSDSAGSTTSAPALVP